MATKSQTRSRPMGHSTVQKSRQKPSVSQRPHSTTTINPKGIKIRFGKNSSQYSMYQPTPILKKRRPDQPYFDQPNETVADWRPPSNLEVIPPRPLYSPVRTPPRLRTIITPPGVVPYRHTQSLRRLHSPLPTIDDAYSAPFGLDAWGLDPSDFNLNSNLNLIRRYPSPLSHFGLGSGLQRQKKPYIVVPRLNNLMSPPDSRTGGNLTVPYDRTEPPYTYPDRLRSFSSPRLQREPSDYVYVRRNEGFANRFVDDFIGTCVEDQLIPDILLEIVSELDQENKKPGGKSYRTQVDSYYTQLNHRLNQKETNHTHLFSDDWIRELDYQRPPIPSNEIDSNLPTQKALTFKKVPPVPKSSRVRYHDLPTNVQGRLLADVNQELIDFEVENMVTELTGQALGDRVHDVPPINDTSHNTYHDIESDIHSRTRDTGDGIHSTQKTQVDQRQYNSIEQYAQKKLLDTMCLDELIMKYIKQNGSVVDVDDLSRLLDVTILGNLMYQYDDIDENRSRTLDNYASRKFHLNTFMNITMDLLLTELSASLIEDMKDLDEQERRTFLR